MASEKIYRIYATEASEIVDRIEGTLRRVGEAPGDLEGVRALRADLHTLKGGAYAVGLAPLGELVHALEDAFPADQPADGQAVARAGAALEAVTEAVQALGAGEAVPEAALAAALAVFRGEAPPAGSTPDAPLDAARVEAVGRVNLELLEELAGRLIEAQGISERLAREARNLLRAEAGEDDGAATRARRQRLANQVLELSVALQQSLGDAAYQSEQLRLRPVDRLLHDARRTFEDALERSGKRGRLVTSGGEILLDRRVAERMQAMLAHIVRNAVDHGFDEPAARRAAGKPAEPTLSLKVVAQGIRVEFQIEDDGAGIDIEAVRAQALERELIDVAEEPTEDELLALVFHAGFTTRQRVSSLSGRGIGLDVVRSTVEAMNGRVRLTSRAGEGTRLRFEVPVSLATSRVLLVQRGGQRLAIPLMAADRALNLADVDLEPVGGRRTFVHQDERIALADLADLYDLSASGAETQAVVVGIGDRRLALGVDLVEEEVEVAVRPVGEPINHCRLTAGLALLSDSSIVPVIDLADVLRHASSARRRRVAAGPAGTAAAAAGPEAAVLIVDDSVTTRTLETDIFAQAGYTALSAKDGVAALEVLAEHAVDLVVADLEMPRMDGLELLSRIRGAPELAQLPVIVVTSRSDQKDRCLAAGADAFVIKRAFDQEELLDEAARLIARNRVGS